jgi:hypothetical protein
MYLQKEYLDYFKRNYHKKLAPPLVDDFKSIQYRNYLTAENDWKNKKNTYVYISIWHVVQCLVCSKLEENFLCQQYQWRRKITVCLVVPFFTSVHSVHGTEWAKIPRKYTEFRVVDLHVLYFRGITRKFAKFCLHNLKFFKKDM